jgi:sugar O-acyltransferase (sialic acid O-acetyltransferase NeuD family)
MQLKPPAIPAKTHKLVIVGDGEFADIAYEYFTYDSSYEVVGFAVERAYLKQDAFHNLPVVAFEDMESHFNPAQVHTYVAITYTKLNQVRERLYHAVKTKGFTCASYISSKAFVWHTASVGDNTFIFENNVIQHGCTIGNNLVLWSGNHIGHQTTLQDHSYLASHIVISGYCNIGERCFIGVNATFADHVNIGPDCFLAMGAFVPKSMEEPNKVIKNVEGVAKPSDKVSAKRYMKADE